MNRKKISLKGVLLALAVSVPPLISTAVFIAPIQSNNQSTALFDKQTTTTSLSEPYINNKNLSIVNDDLTQTVPFKVSIAYIKPFKLVTYRTRSEIEAKIYDLIVLNTRQELIELNKDYEIDFVSNIASDEVVPVQTVKVKAMIDSQYLTGEFSFEIVGRLKLAKNRVSYNNPIAKSFNDELFAKNVFKRRNSPRNVEPNIDESTDDVLALLNILPSNVTNGSTFFPKDFGGLFYYKKIVFQFSPNKLFSTDLITWAEVVPPDYLGPNLNVNHTVSLSFVDSTKKNYDKYPYNDSSSLINKNHNPAKKKWEFSPTITFAEFDVYKIFGFQSVSEFFSWYKLTLDYQFQLNVFTSNSKWKFPEGKDINWSSDSKTWTGAIADPYPWEKEFVTSTKIGYLTKSYGELESSTGWKALAGVHLWMETDFWYSTIIKIKGQTVSAYNWLNQWSYDHAAFALLRGNTLKIERK